MMCDKAMDGGYGGMLMFGAASEGTGQVAGVRHCQ